ncbi:MAG: aminoacyl-histidine dipeptidase [Bacteroidia bacterium]|nr:MAG: aminoacyl-histidine dipeptidase [Bacteroidia bacterium]
MTKVLMHLEPKTLWKYFEEICSIPHPSKKEAAMIEYVKGVGKQLGLETEVDHAGNVLIRKPATPGMSDRKTVVLQGHLDMVPQKNSDTAHDFEKDPIQPYIDGDWVKARGTTLGADNGIGVAAALAVLEAGDLEHGPIEALFTIDEETGMTGAFELKPGFLKGDILINMDSEDEGELYIGCAGGIDTNAFFKYSEEAVPEGHLAYSIDVKGLKGGHSGLDINLGRGNAIKLLNRLLWKAQREMGLRLSSVDGGSLRNAIPREANAVVTVPTDKMADFEEMAENMLADWKNELSSVDPGVQLIIEKTALPEKLIDKNTTANIFNAVYACPNGSIRMVSEMPEVVETSTNLAILKSENGVVEAATLQRSSVDSAKMDLCNMMRAVFELAGAEVEQTGEYPGWKPNVDSPILKTMKEVYQKLYGKIPEQKVIHAGLECGILGGTYPKLDMISFGPTIRNPHSPDEMVNVATVKLFYDYLVETLKHVPQK